MPAAGQRKLFRRNHLSTNDAPAPVAQAFGVADPGPLGLAAFALTTFLLSAKNAGWMGSATGSAWLTYAFAYGGLAQLLAGMWEFRNRNIFGATAFASYGAFWIGLALWVRLVATAAPPAKMLATAYGAEVGKDLAWILLAWAIFTLLMLIVTTQLNTALFVLFLVLEVTFILLAIGNFSASGTNIVKIGGYLGVVTAAAAWYVSFAGLINGVSGRVVAPVGRPLFKFGGAHV
jgi:succinate-acetate transporter protein